jgi:hypothetical protein
MIANVSGSRIWIVAPIPGRERTRICPRSASTLRLTTSIPTPRPDRLVTCSAVEKPGMKISW